VKQDVRLVMNAESDNSLKVTIVLPHENVPGWLRNILFALYEAEGIELTVIVLSTRRCPYKARARAFYAWKWFDDKIFARMSTTAERTEALVDIRRDCKERMDIPFFESRAEDVADNRGIRNTDLIVWMAYQRPPSQLANITSLGVWGLSNAVNQAVGCWELYGAVHVTACELIKYGAVPADDRLLASAYAATDELLLHRSLIAIRAKDQALLMSMIGRVRRKANTVSSELSADNSVSERRSIPNFPQLVWGVGQLYFRYLMDVVKRPFYFEQWQLAYRIGGHRLSQEGMTTLAPKHRGFWADPFVVQRDGRTVIFFEELPEGESCGKIALVEVMDDESVSEHRVVLERDYHLSYPFLFEYQGSLFMIPESAAANRVEAFRCIKFPDQWESHAVLLDGVRAFDPTLIEYENRWWLFVTIQHNGNCSDGELHLFYADGPFEEWTPHPLNPINVDVRSARPAGELFWEEGELFRPAQDCSVCYGYALTIMKIIRMNEREYEEVETQKILPDWSPGALGTHTVNSSGEVTVYDYIAKCRK
jgi:hypothetical protein